MDVDLNQFALEIFTNPEHRFGLARSLDVLDIALPSPSKLLRQRKGSTGKRWAVVRCHAGNSPQRNGAYELAAGGVGALLLLSIAMGDLNTIVFGDIKR